MTRDPGQVARLEGWAASIDAAVARCPHLKATEIMFATEWLDLDPGTIQGPACGVLVGEMPGPHTSGALPMFPYPASSAGGRLQAMSRVPVGDYLGRLIRVNMFREYRTSWRKSAAASTATEMLSRLAGGDWRVVLCGARVLRAFSLEAATFEHFRVGSVELVGVPHPSGRNQRHNDPEVRRQTRRAVRWAARWETPDEEKATT